MKKLIILHWSAYDSVGCCAPHSLELHRNHHTFHSTMPGRTPTNPSPCSSPRLVRLSEVKIEALRVPYILSRYRASPTFAQSVVSLFTLHTETMNIWSHLLPLFPFMYYIMRGPRVDGSTRMECLFYTLHCVGCSSMFAASSTYHTFQSMSVAVHDTLLRIDFAGISLMIATEMFSGIGLGLTCTPRAQQVYLLIAALFGVCLVCAPFASRSLRQLAFISTTVYGLVPLTHFLVTVSGEDRWRIGTPFAMCLICMGAGFAIYSTRFPESVFQRHSFDVFGKRCVASCNAFSPRTHTLSSSTTLSLSLSLLTAFSSFFFLSRKPLVVAPLSNTSRLINAPRRPRSARNATSLRRRLALARLSRCCYSLII